MKTIKPLFIALSLCALRLEAGQFTVTNLADYNPSNQAQINGSLRQAVEAASALPNEFHTIEFDPNLAGVLQLVDMLQIEFSGEIIGPNASQIAVRPSDNSLGIRIIFPPQNPGYFKIQGISFKNGFANSPPVLHPVLRLVNMTIVLEDCEFSGNRLRNNGDLISADNLTSTSFIRNCTFLDNVANSCLSGTSSSFSVINCHFTKNRVGNGLIDVRLGGAVDVLHCTFVENLNEPRHRGVVVDVYWPTVQFQFHRNIFYQNRNGSGQDLPLENEPQVSASENYFDDPHIQRLAKWNGPSYLIPRPESPVCNTNLPTLALTDPVHPDYDTLILTDSRVYNRPATGVHYGAVQVFSEKVPPAASRIDAGIQLRLTISALQNTQAPLDFIVLPGSIHDLDANLPAMGTPVVFLGAPRPLGEAPSSFVHGGFEYSIFACSGDGQGTGKEFGIDGIQVCCGVSSVVNRAGGFSSFYGARVFVADTLFLYCKNTGLGAAGAVSILGGSARFERCVVALCDGVDSRPGGINIAPGFPEAPAIVDIKDSLFVENTCDQGGSAAIAVSGSHLTLTHCSVLENTTTSGTSPVGVGVGLASSNSSLILQNSVINKNLRAGIADDLLNAGSTTTRSSMVTVGSANFFNFPYGTNWLAGVPSPGSAVINAASPNYATEYDLLGAPRNAFGLPDIGAVEYFADNGDRILARSFRDAPCQPVARLETLGLDRNPDGDPFPTWLELIAYTDPNTPDIVPMDYKLDVTQNRFEITVLAYSHHLKNYFGIEWVPNRSFDLVNWLGRGNYTSIEGVSPIRPGSSSRTIFVNGINPAIDPRQFFRIELARPAKQPYPCLIGIGEPNGNSGDPENGHGVVNFPLAISKYEVTNAEYAAFLRVVDPRAENQRGLWVAEMEADKFGGIVQVGKSYEAKVGRESHPVNFVTYDSARRYCNWLHNGAHALSSTESGAYDMTSDGAREAGAQWFLPTFDEFYKAAYFVSSNGPAPLFQPIYQDYPTGNSINADFPGDSESANFQGLDTRPVGSYPAPSIWGAYDMAGNVREMLESANSSNMFTKGGSYADPAFGAAYRDGQDLQPKSTPTAHTGFRVAACPPRP